MIKVLGLGDNVVDKYMHIKTMYPGGNALNIAVLARLSGIEVGYLGVFGDDEAAKHVYKTVSDMGIDVSHCRFYHGENGYAEVRLDDGDRVFIGSNQGGVSKEHPIDSFTDIELDYIAEYDVCHTSIFSYVEESLPEIRKASGFVSFDFSNRYDEEYLKKVCPYIDMAAISCGDMPKEEMFDAAPRMRSGITDRIQRKVAAAIRMDADFLHSMNSFASASVMRLTPESILRSVNSSSSMSSLSR